MGAEEPIIVRSGDTTLLVRRSKDQELRKIGMLEKLGRSKKHSLRGAPEEFSTFDTLTFAI